MAKNKDIQLVTENKKDYISITDVAYIIGVSGTTISRWYKWWESPEFIKPDDLQLPKYYYMDRRKTKYFKKSDIDMLKSFKVKVVTTHKGCMADFNAVYQWGKRGQKILTNMGSDYKEVKGKLS